jgi:hypothetical protein
MGRARGAAQGEDRGNGQLMGIRPAALLAIAAAVGYAGCASQGMPPGGPPDTAAPTLAKVLPESGTLSVTPRAVEFQFNEVVSERPRGAQGLQQLVVISPSDGEAQVDWARNRLVVRPGRGWRPNTAYTVTVLSGLTDLRGNAAGTPFRTVFATGSTIPIGVLRGNAFDWMAGRHAPGARIEAQLRGDTTLTWSIAADSIGRFELSSLPADTFLVRGWIDANNNAIRDRAESWDTTTVVVRDSARVEFYAFPHDTSGARLSEVSLGDSLSIRIKFDRGLRPANPLEGATIQVVRARDSVALAIARILPVAVHDSLQRAEAAARIDSIARADTSAAARRRRAQEDSAQRRRVQDSLAQAQIASVRAARDTAKVVQLPKPSRPVPPTEFVIVMSAPLPEEVPLLVVAREVQALLGPRRTSQRQLIRRRPPPRDSTATKAPPPAPPTRPPE